jgi:hypothetical protein
MTEVLGEIRQKLSRAAEMAKGVQRLHASGIVDLGNLGVTLQTVKNSRVYGQDSSQQLARGIAWQLVDEHHNSGETEMDVELT